MASKHRDIGLRFRHRSTPNTRRVTKDVGFGGGGTIFIYRFISYMQADILYTCMTGVIASLTRSMLLLMLHAWNGVNGGCLIFTCLVRQHWVISLKLWDCRLSVSLARGWREIQEVQRTVPPCKREATYLEIIKDPWRQLILA